MIIPTPQALLGDDVSKQFTKEDDPNWQIMNRCQALRKKIAEEQRELAMLHGISLDMDQSQLQIQVLALIKLLCPTQEDRWIYEECYFSAMAEAVEQVMGQAGRAKLLGGVNQAQIVEINKQNGKDA